MAAIVGFGLVMVLLIALLLSGFYLLGKAATIAMVPMIGEAGALAVTGLVCFLFLALVFYRLSHSAAGSRSNADDGSGSDRSPVALLRDLIRTNPLESAIVAFAFGVAENTDPRLKSLLLEGSMELMKRDGSGTGGPEPSKSHDAESDNPEHHARETGPTE